MKKLKIKQTINVPVIDFTDERFNRCVYLLLEELRAAGFLKPNRKKK